MGRGWIGGSLIGMAAVSSLAAGETAVERSIRRAERALENGFIQDAEGYLRPAERSAPDDPRVRGVACRITYTRAVWTDLSPTATPEEIRVAFRAAAGACARASEVVTDAASRLVVLRHRARATIMGELVDEVLPAYEAWADAAPDDSFAQGGLAAALDRSGRIQDAEQVLERAAARSGSVGHRSRFEYLCRRADRDTRERLRPIAQALYDAETVPQGRAMIEVILANLADEPSGFESKFLEVIDRGVLDPDDARRLWRCVSDTGNPASFANSADESRFVVLRGSTPDPPGRLEGPRRLKAPPPRFPEEMRKRFAEGRAIVVTRIHEDGTVHPVWVSKATTPEFAKAAREAIERWTFEPARVDGKAIPVIYWVRVSFRLRR